MNPLLQLTDVHAFYGKSHVLHGVNFNARSAGEIVSAAGAQWIGPVSTTVKTIIGLVDGHRLGPLARPGTAGPARPSRSPTRGIGYVPENRDIFPSS